MSHYCVLVRFEGNLNDPSQIRRKTRSMLAPYSEHLEMPEYETACYCMDDPPCVGSPNLTCEACGGTGKKWTTRNPKGKWDHWKIGGQWARKLALKNGATGLTANHERQLVPSNQRCDVALALDVAWQNFTPTFAVLEASGWHQKSEPVYMPVPDHEKDCVEKWPILFDQRFLSNFTSTTVVAIVDCHI